MATINLRVEDSLRDALDRKAAEEGVTVSEYIRSLILESVVPSRQDGTESESDYAPETLSARDRQVLALLHRILGRVLPSDANDVDGNREYQLERAAVLEHGYTAEYGTEFAGIYPELSLRDCRRVMDILDMFRMIDYALRTHREGGVDVDETLARSLRYEGFDFNDSLEGRLADYVEYLLSQGKWQERRTDIERTDHGNSHTPMLAVYLRMLTAYRRIMDARPMISRWRDPLSEADLRAISDAQTHPSRRNS